MRIAICWSLISGYMAACWRALATYRDVELKVLAWRPDVGQDHIDFGLSVVAGLNIQLLDAHERTNARLLQQQIQDHRPDTIMVSGWFWKPYRRVVDWACAQRIPTIMAMDNALQFTPRQLLGRWMMAAYFKKIAGVYVPGERAYQMARLLGFLEPQIRIGSYGFDYRLFEDCLNVRATVPEGWPRSFLYVGRYVERKGIDTLIEAYARYRQQVADPWTLVCCGQGPLEERLAAVPGITNRGFVQPNDLPATMIQAGALVLPSRFEAWGVALAEAGAAGLPLIASRSVGATVEILRDFYNGRLFDTGDAPALAAALRWMHDHADQAATLGARSRLLAEPFRAELWAEKFITLSRGIMTRGR